MIVKIIHSGISIELTYDNDGRFQHAKNMNNDSFMMIESIIEGKGYTTSTSNTMSLGKIKICDVRYVRIMDIDLFIPNYLFIKI